MSEAVAAAETNLATIRDRGLEEITAIMLRIQGLGEKLRVKPDAALQMELYTASNSLVGIAGVFGLGPLGGGRVQPVQSAGPAPGGEFVELSVCPNSSRQHAVGAGWNGDGAGNDGHRKGAAPGRRSRAQSVTRSAVRPDGVRPEQAGVSLSGQCQDGQDAQRDRHGGELPAMLVIARRRDPLLRSPWKICFQSSSSFISMRRHHHSLSLGRVIAAPSSSV